MVVRINVSVGSLSRLKQLLLPAPHQPGVGSRWSRISDLSPFLLIALLAFFPAGPVARFNLLITSVSWLLTAAILALWHVRDRRLGRKSSHTGEGGYSEAFGDESATAVAGTDGDKVDYTAARSASVAAALLWVLASVCERTALDPVAILSPRAFMPACLAAMFFFLYKLSSESTSDTVAAVSTTQKPPSHIYKFSSLVEGHRKLLVLSVITGAIALGEKYALPSSVVLGWCSVVCTAGSFLLLWVGLQRSYSSPGRNAVPALTSASPQPGVLLTDNSPCDYPPSQTHIFQRDFGLAVGLGCAVAALAIESLPSAQNTAEKVFPLPFGFKWRTQHAHWQIKMCAVYTLISAARNVLFLVSIRNHGPMIVSFLFLTAAILDNASTGVSLWGLWFGTVSVLVGTVVCLGIKQSSSHSSSGPLHLSSWLDARRSRTISAIVLFSLGIWALSTLAGASQSSVHISRLGPNPPFSAASNAAFAPLELHSTASHPIEQLMDHAMGAFERTKARQSKTLAEAVAEYRRRYRVAPPPNFDRWYEFAVRKGYVMIDEFDSIFHDLQPFWALEPAVIRKRAIEGISNGRNFLAGLYVRNGQVVLTERGQAWARDSLIGMMSQFAEFLPDMDLAFNIHDEPRVVVPHDRLAKMVARAQGEAIPRAAGVDRPENRFSARPADLSERGGSIQDYRFTVFNRFAHQNAWSHARQSCPPDSPAQQIDDDTPDNKTAYALSPLGFIYNQTALEDVCLTPSLRHSHGLFDLPNALNIAHDLFPVFSQSKVSSFQDIVYPSPWYWADKVPYDPSEDVDWDPKAPALYWRGSTTGGYSEFGAWRRHHRQRAVMKMNGLDEASQANRKENAWILEEKEEQGAQTDESGSSGSGWRPKRVPLSSYSGHFDVRFSHVGQCDQSDCLAQSRFFTVGDRITRSKAFRYKFVLDLDGNAFSGRFYAFMRSASVVVKQSIFREWHSGVSTGGGGSHPLKDSVGTDTEKGNEDGGREGSREGATSAILVPWVHYIPLSLNGDEWLETMRYFIDHPDGQARARAMATRQAEWANKALRKDDLEVYFFRLLLEYGRLVDERREVIGFAG